MYKSWLRNNFKRISCCLFLIAILVSVALAQQPDSNGKPLELDKAISQLREIVEKDIQLWREIFKGLKLETSYEPDVVAGFWLRGGRSSMESQLAAISGLIAFQKINGDKVLNDALPKLKDLLLDFQECNTERSCPDLENELKALSPDIESPPSGINGYDPEKIFATCIAQQDPKSPCTKQFCVNAAVMGGSFLLLLSMNDTAQSQPLTVQQKQREAEIDDLIRRMNKVAAKAQQMKADENCKDMSKFVPAFPKKP